MNNLRLHDGILVGGVDEAGRGSIIGPLVVAGISIRESKIAQLTEMGVRDSKALTPKARARLFGEIMKVADSVCIRKINPIEVDDSVSLRGLNRLEAKVMASVINNIGADEVAAPAVVGGVLQAPQDALGRDYNSDGKGIGFNVPSLLGLHALQPYMHNGAAESLAQVVADVKHRTDNGRLPDLLALA